MGLRRRLRRRFVDWAIRELRRDGYVVERRPSVGGAIVPPAYEMSAIEQLLTPAVRCGAPHPTQPRVCELGMFHTSPHRQGTGPDWPRSKGSPFGLPPTESGYGGKP